MTLLSIIFNISFLQLSHDAGSTVSCVTVVLQRGDGVWVSGTELAKILALFLSSSVILGKSNSF